MKVEVLFLLLILFGYVVTQVPTCSNKYDLNTTLPQNCSNNVCKFQSLIPLINGSNPTNDSVFVLCLLLPSYEIVIDSN